MELCGILSEYAALDKSNQWNTCAVTGWKPFTTTNTETEKYFNEYFSL